MKKLKNQTAMTAHFLNDRIPRGVFIGTTVGFGEVVDVFRCESDKHGPHTKTITSTGVMIIKSTVKEGELITLYFATPKQLYALYSSKEQTPIHLVNVVMRNKKNHMCEKMEAYLRKELEG